MKQYLVYADSPPEGGLEIIGAVCVVDVADDYENDDEGQIAYLGHWEELDSEIKKALLEQVYETWQNNEAITEALWDHVYTKVEGAWAEQRRSV